MAKDDGGPRARRPSRRRAISRSSKAVTVRCFPGRRPATVSRSSRRRSRARRTEIRAYGKRLEKAVEDDPHVLAPLQLHYLRWVLFDIGG